MDPKKLAELSVRNSDKVYTEEQILAAIKECKDELNDPNTVPRRAANIEYALDKWEIRLIDLQENN